MTARAERYLRRWPTIVPVSCLPSRTSSSGATSMPRNGSATSSRCNDAVVRVREEARRVRAGLEAIPPGAGAGRAGGARGPSSRGAGAPRAGRGGASTRGDHPLATGRRGREGGWGAGVPAEPQSRRRMQRRPSRACEERTTACEPRRSRCGPRSRGSRSRPPRWRPRCPRYLGSPNPGGQCPGRRWTSSRNGGRGARSALRRRRGARERARTDRARGERAGCGCARRADRRCAASHSCGVAWSSLWPAADRGRPGRSDVARPQGNSGSRGRRSSVPPFRHCRGSR